MFILKNNFENIGKLMGFIFSYFIFTTIMFYMLLFLNKIPGLTYLYAMGISASITTIGIIVNKILK